MIYLFDSELSENKSVVFAMTKIVGIGKSNSEILCKKLGFSPNFKFKNMSKEQVAKLISVIESSNLILTEDLKKIKSQNFKTLFSIKSYRGLRLKQGLPVRGQRTHTNARTARKKR
jgi:small subunit ribosomal protein S13